MSGFFQDLLTGAAEGFFGGDYLRDYTHASKTFRPNIYQNAPKLKFLFHTYFEINQEIYDAGLDNRQNFGLLVKDIKLPDYSFDTTTFNQYNRKRVIQTKIKYDPITVTFHDDNASQATKLWEAYYRYNYRDGDNPDVVFSRIRGNGNNNAIDYNTRNIYEPLNTGDWGYSGDTFNGKTRKIPFFKNITVFGFYQHNFTAYTLINPIITRFAHDSYNYNEGGGIMQNTMVIDYETVVYNYGAIDGDLPSNIATSFGNPENYDTRLSPIAIPGANAKILGAGGLVDAVGGTIEALGSGNIIGAIKSAGTAYYTFKDRDLKEIAKQEVLNGAHEALVSPNTTRAVFAYMPKIGSSPNTTATSSTPPPGNSNTTLPEANPPSGQQVYSAQTFPVNDIGSINRRRF